SMGTWQKRKLLSPTGGEGENSAASKIRLREAFESSHLNSPAQSQSGTKALRPTKTRTTSPLGFERARGTWGDAGPASIIPGATVSGDQSCVLPRCPDPAQRRSRRARVGG